MRHRIAASPCKATSASAIELGRYNQNGGIQKMKESNKWKTAEQAQARTLTIDCSQSCIALQYASTV